MFGTKLEDAVKDVSGGQAAILMGFDGIPVDMYTGESQLDIETVGMEFSVLLKEVRKAAEMLDAGAAEEVMVRTEQMSTVLRVVNEEYFLAMAVSAGGNLGKARYLLRLLAPEMRRELI
jgi:predicted regulator of Ras-like GTPase activity (Roadblock/LC7/MglB family)